MTKSQQAPAAKDKPETKTPTPSIFAGSDEAAPKPDKANDTPPKTGQVEEPENASPQPSPYRILKQAICPKLSPRAKGDLTYDIGYTEDDQAYHFRIVANGSSGYFSNEWITLKAIQEVLDQQEEGSQFKAIVLKGLYVKKGANNHGFLAAALRAEKILEPVDGQPLLHTIAKEFDKKFDAAMQKLIKQGIGLTDTVAERARQKAEARAERIKQAQSAAEQRKNATGGSDAT